LKHWDFRFVYWHTFTELKVWDRLWKNQIVWKINKSWMSTGYHLHLELWKRNSNIKFSHLQWKEIVASNKSDELRSQRWWITDKEINTEILVFIWSFEWFRTKAYPDWFNPDWSIRYSIWKWTKSFKWEVITLEEAKKRARKEIQSVRDRYSLQEHPIHIQKAVVSFVYNIWSLTQKQKALLDGRYYRALWNSFLQYDKMTVIKDGEKEKVIAWWLVKRRQAEFNLLTK
jgi:GH24 family phage-related lysozyme (muramidase)